jgi:hypothetical protein
MKKIISICVGFILFLWITMFLASCTSVKRVNVYKRNNYYERHRANTYTSPMWVPGIGVVLQTHIVPKRCIKKVQPKRTLSPRTPRGKY